MAMQAKKIEATGGENAFKQYVRHALVEVVFRPDGLTTWKMVRARAAETHDDRRHTRREGRKLGKIAEALLNTDEGRRILGWL